MKQVSAFAAPAVCTLWSAGAVMSKGEMVFLGRSDRPFDREVIMDHKEQVLRALIARLADKDWEVRQEAASALGGLGASAAQAVRPLTKALGDTQRTVRRQAAWALGQIASQVRLRAPDVQHVPVQLAIALKDESDGLVRAEIASALGTIGPAAANVILCLIDALGDQSWEVRLEAVRALGAMRTAIGHAGVKALRRAIEVNPHPDIRQAADEALTAALGSGKAQILGTR